MARLPLLVSFVLGFAPSPSPCQGSNQALYVFSGTDGYVDVPFNATVVPRAAITVEAWVTYDDASLSPSVIPYPTLLRQNCNPGAESYFLRVEAGPGFATVLRWFVKARTQRADVTWNFSPSQLNSWTHIAGTYDGSIARLFINGVEVANAPGSGQIPGNSQTLRIGDGDLAVPGAETWNGSIDEVRLWPVARTAAEIAATMNLELASVPGEVSTWNLNGNASDSSGNNGGSLVGTTQFVSGGNLSASLVGARANGAATPGCEGPPAAGVLGVAKVGNAAFGLYCVRTAKVAGVLWFGAATQTPFTVAGAQLWIDPTQPGVALIAQPTALGLSRSALPIPNKAFLANKTFGAQYFWVQPGCAVPLFASGGLQMTILP